MSIIQLKLPMRYRCANAECRETTFQQHLFCGQSCFEAMERANRGGKVDVFKKETVRENNLMAFDPRHQGR